MKARVKQAFSVLLQRDSSIARGFSSILTLRVVEKLSGFIVSVLLFRLLEKEMVAEYGFIQTIVAICAVFGIQEFQNTISQSVARGHHGTYRQAVVLAFKWSFVGAAILVGFGAWYIWHGKAQLGFGFLIAAALFPAFHALSQWKGVCLGEKNFTLFTVAEASNAILKALLIVTSLFIFPGSILGPIIIFFAVPAAQNIRQTLLCYRKIPEHAVAEEGSIAYGFRANKYSAIGTVADQFDRILIFTMLAPPLLAIFMAAEKFAELLQGIVQDLGAVLAPKFSTIQRYTRQLDDILKLVSVIIGIFIILFAIFALPSLVVLVFGEGYRESVLYAQFLVGAVAVRNIATLRFRFIRSKLDAVSYRNILLVSSVGRVVVSAALIPLFGLPGAVASVLFHRLVLATIIGHTIRTKYLNEAKN